MQHDVVSADGTRLSVRVRGEGPPVVLVHGAGSSSADWSGLARVLADEHRVLAYDRRGRGQSDDGPTYSFVREIEDLHAVLAWVDEPAHLVGHSFGARVCLAAAAEADLRTLTLYEPPIALDRGESDVIKQARAAHEAGDWEGVLEAFQPAAGMTPDEIAVCKELSDVRAAQRDAARNQVRELAGIAERPAVPGRLGIPVLLVAGELSTSPVYLDGLDVLADALGATRVQLPGQRHIGMAADPQGFASLLRAHLAAGGGL